MESELAEFNKELEMKSAQEEAEAERSLRIDTQGASYGIDGATEREDAQ